jgi:hypothetical protein
MPSRQVHNDHTVNSVPRRVRDHLGADAEELLKHRLGIVNVASDPWAGAGFAARPLRRAKL